MAYGRELRCETVRIVTEGGGWACDGMLPERSAVVGVSGFLYCPVWKSPAPGGEVTGALETQPL